MTQDSRDKAETTDTSYAIPMGRFSDNGDGGPHDKGSLIGRISQRGYLINLLINKGSKGAYLVTGRRGVGKTSFVEYCLKEYEDSSPNRYLRSRGQSSIIQSITITLFILSSIVLLLFLHDLLNIFSALSTESHLLWPLIVGCFIILLIPGIYGIRILKGLILCVTKSTEAWFFATLSAIAIALYSWYDGPLGSPAISTAFYIHILSSLYFIGQFNFGGRDDDGKIDEIKETTFSRNLISLFGRKNYKILRKIKIHTYRITLKIFQTLKRYMVVDIFLLLIFMHFSSIQFFSFTNKTDKTEIFWGSIIASMTILIASCITRAIVITSNTPPKLEKLRKNRKSKTTDTQENKNTGLDEDIPLSATRYSILGTARWFIIFSIIGFIILSITISLKTEETLAVSFEIISRTFSILILIVIAKVAIYISSPNNKRKSRTPKHNKNRLSNRTRADILLLLKAFMAIGISIQLLHPAVTSIQRYITPEIANQQKGGGDQIEGDQIAPPRPLHAASEIPLFRPSYLETRPRQKSAPPDQSGSQTIKLSTIFSTKTEEVLWVFGVFSLIVLFIVVEYDWLVRPLLRQRDAPVSAPPNSPWHETLGGILSDPGTQREAGKVLERLTFPWMLFHAWLPTLVARVNLGFDRLDHRSVIQAMLIALREGYHRQFIAMQSLRGLVFRFLGFMAVVILMSQASATWFHIPLLTSDKLLPSKDGPPRRNYCDLVLDPDNHVGEAARLLCSMNNGGLLFDIAYYEIIPLHYVAPFQGKSRVLEWLVDYNPALPHAANVAIAENYQQDIEIHDRSASATATNTDKNLQNENITAEEYNKRKEENAMMAMSFRVYHLGLLILFFTLGKMFLATLPIIPYGRNLAKIDQLLDSLSARRITKRGPMEWKPARWIFSALGSQTEQTLDHAPVDPRTIELAFLHILEDLQPEKHRWERRHIAALPTPEITFVFDELDKLGARAEPEGGILSNIREEFEQISHERRRSIALHNLLSDLKRVISSAPARFIFVGGRLLHDEWLADQTARSPLLTSIFDAQIHIPSFLTDRSPIPSADRWEKHKLHSRTRELLGRIHDNSWEFQHLWTAQRWRPFVGLVKFTSRPPAFIDTQPRSRNAPLPIRHLRVYEVATGRPLVFPWHRDNRPQYVLPGDKSQANVWEWQFQNELTYFLTYRSAGNPKKLRDLLSSLVRSSDQVFTDLGDRRWNNGDLVCQDVLYFPSNDILRVQFVAYIYRHLNDRLKEQVVFRDDKIAAAVFSITDFLFKFHGRAFSWHNIERIDELVHIHRAPDLREIMEDMVQHFSHRFLHTVLNGMYTFRFRSEVSKEIEYLSQHSEEEMAALNFTLDESQSLKLLYAMALKADQGRNKDLLNGLGELYEFDGDYDSARQHYKAALTLADDELKQLLGAAKGPVWQALSATDLGRQMVRRAIPWGVVRIRLMLQIGMTFEQAGHMERAEAEYHSATQLAWTIFSVYLEEDAAEAAVPNPFDEPALANHGNILKHMSLVYQPAMAVAWTSEKLIGDIDTSTTIVEKYIRDVRARLPFLTAKWNTRSFNKKLTLHSNFALIAADLHNKAGDLYFLKGRGPVQPMHLWAERAKGRTGNEFDGYLCKAYTHYATGLHELRRYISYRQETTGHKFNDSGRPSHTAEHWPSYVSLSAASASNDLAEAMLARVSLSRLPGEGKTFALLSADGHTPETPSEAANHAIYQDAWDFLRPFHRWMQEEQGDATDDPPPSDQKLHLRHRGKRWDLGHFEDWLGQWDNDDVTPVHHLGAAAQSNGDDTAPNIKRLLFSLNMSLVGGQCNEASGYLQDAAKEYVWVAESVSRLLWSGLMLEAILSNAECHDTIDPRLAKIYGGWLGTNGNWTNIIQYLVGMAVEALLRADKLYRRQHPHTKPITARLEKGKAKVIGEAPEVGDIIPAATFTTATSLLLVACRYEEAFTQPPSSGGEVLTPDIDRLARQLRIWTNRVPPDASATRLDRVRDAMDTLETILRYRRYPVLNLVNGLKTLVDAHVLVRIPLWAMDESSIPNEEKEKIIKSEREKAKIWLGDLRVVNNRYNAPFHFTPGQMAQTLFCWHFIEEREKLTTVRQGTYSEIQDSIGDHFFINDNLRELMRRIKQATEMVSMGRAYYDAISSLFYLYDDFNDRMIHFNHAQQMMNLEVISLIELLTEKQHGGGGALGLKRPLD